MTPPYYSLLNMTKGLRRFKVGMLRFCTSTSMRVSFIHTRIHTYIHTHILMRYLYPYPCCARMSCVLIHVRIRIWASYLRIILDQLVLHGVNSTWLGQTWVELIGTTSILYNQRSSSCELIQMFWICSNLRGL